MSYRIASRQQIDNADCNTLEAFAGFVPKLTNAVRKEQAVLIDPNVMTVDVHRTECNGLPYSVSFIDGEPFMINTATFNNDPDDGMPFATLYFWMLEPDD